MFDGVSLQMDRTCALFITMSLSFVKLTVLPYVSCCFYHFKNKMRFNPKFVYIFHSENLKIFFRPISMMTPDFIHISEIELLSVGYKNAKSLATKLVTTYRLCSELLSDEAHYDFGMRAIKSALRLAKLKKRHCANGESEDEDEIVLRAISDVNLSKLQNIDVPIFEVCTIAINPRGNGILSIEFHVFSNRQSYPIHFRAHKLPKSLTNDFRTPFKQHARRIIFNAMNTFWKKCNRSKHY